MTAVNQMVADAVLGKLGPAGPPPQAFGVGLVVAHERRGIALAAQGQLGQAVVLCVEQAGGGVDGGYVVAARKAPRPGVAEPQRRQHVQGVALGAAVGDGDDDAHVGRGGLRVINLDCPVAVLVEGAGVDELVLGLETVTGAVGVDQVVVGELALWIVVDPRHPGMGGRGVGVPPVLLGVLTVVALVAGQPEQPLLEDGVPPVPEREREAEGLPVVADAGQAVLVPPVRPRARVVVRQVVPRLAPVAVVLADGSPGTLRQVGSPAPPSLLSSGGRVQAELFGIHVNLSSANCWSAHRVWISGFVRSLRRSHPGVAGARR
jgi:hypothetical protein